MKITKLLVLSTLFALAANSSKAAVPEGVWTVPDPKGLEFTTFTADETHYYLYNPATKMFFSSGNGWNTMASLRTFGMEVWLKETTETGAPEGSYELWDNNKNPDKSTGERNIFSNDNTSWVDRADQSDYSWAYEIVGDCVRLQNVAFIANNTKFEGTYIGFDGTYELEDVDGGGKLDHRTAYSAILRHVNPSAPGVSVDWRAVTVESYEAFAASEDYTAYVNDVKCYIASLGLKDAIEEAEKLYVDVTAALAVYTNTESTPDQLKKATTELTSLINAKKKLQAAIEDFENKGFTGTDAAKAVLTNPQATVAQIEQAQTDLNAVYEEWAKNQASVANPSDMTTKIVNPTFDNGDVKTGWSGTEFGRGGEVADGAEHYNRTYDTYQKITGLAPGVYAVGMNGFYRAGDYKNNDGLLDGVKNWLAKNEASRYAKLYAKSGENSFETSIANVMSGAQPQKQFSSDVEITYTDENGDPVTVYVPNMMNGADYYFHTLHQYANKLYAAVDESGELTIGVKKEGQVNNDWSLFDDFSLTYYGKGDDAVDLFAKNAWTFTEYVPADEELYTESYLETYNDLVKNYNPDEVTSIAAFFEIKANAEAAYAALKKNIELWKQLDDIYGTIEDNSLEWSLADPWIKDDGLEDLFDEIDDALQDLELENDALEAMIAKANALIEECKEFLKTKLNPGDDVTRYVVNPGFEDGVKTGVANPSGLSGDYGTAVGWNADKTQNGTFTSGPKGSDNKPEINHSFEAWHCWGFDLWQEVKGLPAGVYQLEVQGFVRCDRDGYTRGDSLEGNVPVKLYLNNSMSDFPSIYSQHIYDYSEENAETPTTANGESWSTVNGEKFPDNMASAGTCFNWGMYKKSAYGLVKAGESMRVGVKTVNMNENWWVIWDNFHLTYQGFLPKYVRDALKEALTSLDSTDKQIGTDVKEKAQELIDQANTLMADFDNHAANDEAYGLEMYTLLNKIYEFQPAIIESEALFIELSEAYNNLNKVVVDYYDSPAYDEASNLLSALYGVVEEKSVELTNAQAKEYIGKLNAMLTKLRLPDMDFTKASDENPLDLTAVIMSPSFEIDEDEDGIPDNSNAGWNNPGNLGYGASDKQVDQKLAFAMEFWQEAFDLYQEFFALPAGTYMLEVDGWCRNGDNVENYEGWLANPDSTMAYLYAEVGDGTRYTAPIANMMKGAPTENFTFHAQKTFLDKEGNETNAVNELEKVELGEEKTTYWLPSTLVGGRSFLNIGKTADSDSIIFTGDGVYTSKVVFKVKENDKLRIGVKKAEQRTSSWVVLDDFRLIYYGANSSIDPSGLVESVSVAKPVKVEFFTLDGRKVTRVQKGVIIQKVTLDNGAVVVRKVRR